MTSDKPESVPALESIQELKALYQNLVQRFGSESQAQGQIFSWMRELYDLFAADVMIGFFFFGKDLDLIARMQSEFLLRAMGATASYHGKPPASAHLELAPIRTGHFDRRLQMLRDYLPTRGLTTEQVSAWIAFENIFRDVVVA